jgi:hypothetical protein
VCRLPRLRAVGPRPYLVSLATLNEGARSSAPRAKRSSQVHIVVAGGQTSFGAWLPGWSKQDGFAAARRARLPGGG